MKVIVASVLAAYVQSVVLQNMETLMAQKLEMVNKQMKKVAGADKKGDKAKNKKAR